MSKLIFIVPGFKHQANEPQYKWMKIYFKSLGFGVKVVPILWDRRVMSQYIEQFKDYYSRNKGDTNYVLGFSFGAMIAMISAPNLHPTRLYLCSLSPYF